MIARTIGLWQGTRRYGLSRSDLLQITRRARLLLHLLHLLLMHLLALLNHLEVV